MKKFNLRYVESLKKNQFKHDYLFKYFNDNKCILYSMDEFYQNEYTESEKENADVVYTNFSTSVGIWDNHSWNKVKENSDEYVIYYVDYPNERSQSNLSAFKNFYYPNEFTWNMFREIETRDFNPINERMLKLYFHKFRCEWMYRMFIQYIPEISLKDFVLKRMNVLFKMRVKEYSRIDSIQLNDMYFETTFVMPHDIYHVQKHLNEDAINA